jgi:hypothetical protein
MTMDRKKALALAATVTGVLASTTVAVAAVTGVSVLGFGGTHTARLSSLASYETSADASPGVITHTTEVYDKVVVEGTPRAVAAAAPAGLMAPPAAASQPAGAAAPAVVTPRLGPARHRRHPAPNTPTTARSTGSPRPASTPTTEPTGPEPTDPPVIAPPSTTSTIPLVTTTTRPPGVPRDWPPGKPIPPMPPNCRHPQLEDNGVWNCGDD